jgi:CBS-domain-containing membrane protein
MKVEQLMIRQVETCTPGDSLNVAAKAMWERDCGCVPVVEWEDGGARVVGILTDRDVCMAAYTQGRPLADITVESAMAREVRSCRSTDTLGTVLKVLEQNRLRRLPVLDQHDHLVGVVSLSDAAREAGRQHGRGSKDVTETRVGEVLQAISAPRTPHAVAVAAA